MEHIASLPWGKVMEPMTCSTKTVQHILCIYVIRDEEYAQICARVLNNEHPVSCMLSHGSPAVWKIKIAFDSRWKIR